jgi:thymidine kinase
MKQDFVIFTGPMFGGKTSRMFSQLERAKYQKKVIKLFKPNIDTRYSNKSVVSHNGNRWESIPISDGKEIYDNLGKADVIAVDEAFMIPNVAEVLLDLYKKGKQIYVSSLQLSSEGTAFPEMTKMFPWATKVEVCPAVCFCGNDAYYTITLTEKEEEVTIGGKETYEPRCKEHTNFIGV